MWESRTKKEVVVHILDPPWLWLKKLIILRPVVTLASLLWGLHIHVVLDLDKLSLLLLLNWRVGNGTLVYHHRLLLCEHHRLLLCEVLFVAGGELFQVLSGWQLSFGGRFKHSRLADHPLIEPTSTSVTTFKEAIVYQPLLLQPGNHLISLSMMLTFDNHDSTHCSLVHCSALVKWVPYRFLLPPKQRCNDLILHLPHRLDVLLRQFPCASLEECQVRLAYLRVWLR